MNVVTGCVHSTPHVSEGIFHHVWDFSCLCLRVFDLLLF